MGVWGYGKMEHGGTGIWENGKTAYSPAFSYRKSIPDLKSWICDNTVCGGGRGGENAKKNLVTCTVRTTAAL